MQAQFSLLTYGDLPDLDPDDRFLLHALEKRGFRAQPLIWNDPSVDWDQAGVCVVRSTWDYHRDPRGFADWIDNVAARAPLFNVPKLLRWNMNKRYLLDLEQRGVTIVPTVLC
ncbi:MAG: hypothetical protein ACRD3W_18165, partial [Terriglobales bacterium]